jgi:tetratricopeptide (TPR) repeat protein
MEDAKNKEILEINASSFIKHIQDTKQLLSQTESIKSSKGNHSLEYWTNQLEIATLSTAICSEKKSVSFLQEVENGLVADDLTESYEYAQVLFLLSNNTYKHPDIAEKYFIKQIEVLEKTPQYFAYISDTDAYNSLAVCQMKQGKYDEAQENYQKALTCLERDASYSDQPGYKNVLATVYHNLGRNLYFLGNYKESVDYFAKSIALQEEVNGTIMPKTIVYMSESQDKIARTK